MEEINAKPRVHEIVDIIVEVGKSGIAAFRRRTDDSIYPGMLNMVTGHIRQDRGDYLESPLDAAVREFAEETGLEISRERFAFAGEHTYVDHTFGLHFHSRVYVLRISEEEFSRIAETEHVPGSKRIIPYHAIHECLSSSEDPRFNPVERALLDLFTVRRS